MSDSEKMVFFSGDNVRFKWVMSSAQYIKEAIKNIELHLALQDQK